MAATAKTLTITEKVTYDGGSVQADKAVTGDAQIAVAIDVPATTTDKQSIVAVDMSRVTGIYIKSDQDVTLETNHPAGTSTAADETLSLKANVPYMWHSDSYFTNLLLTDITCIYLTNAGATAAVVDILIVYDSTP
jgi:hypothetical protein